MSVDELGNYIKEVTELYDFINDAVSKEYKEEQERLRIKKEQELKEIDEMNNMLIEIDTFFKPLFEPFIYMVDVSQYQTLATFPYLYIYRCRDDLDIWGSNLEQEQDVNNNYSIDRWNFDFIKALYDNKEKILFDIAKKYGYV